MLVINIDYKIEKLKTDLNEPKHCAINSRGEALITASGVFNKKDAVLCDVRTGECNKVGGLRGGISAVSSYGEAFVVEQSRGALSVLLNGEISFSGRSLTPFASDGESFVYALPGRIDVVREGDGYYFEYGLGAKPAENSVETNIFKTDEWIVTHRFPWPSALTTNIAIALPERRRVIKLRFTKGNVFDFFDVLGAGSGMVPLLLKKGDGRKIMFYYFDGTATAVRIWDKAKILSASECGVLLNVRKALKKKDEFYLITPAGVAFSFEIKGFADVLCAKCIGRELLIVASIKEQPFAIRLSVPKILGFPLQLATK